FATHDQVEVAQTDVEVDDGGLVATQGQAGCEAGAGRRLADAPLAGGHHDDLGHGWRSFLKNFYFGRTTTNRVGWRRSALSPIARFIQSSMGSKTRRSPSRRIWAGLPRTLAGSGVSVVR